MAIAGRRALCVSVGSSGQQDDAETICDLAAKAGYDALMCSDPTLDVLNEAIECARSELERKLSKSEEVGDFLLSFSGHGKVDNGGTWELAQQTEVTNQGLFDWLKIFHQRARILVLSDCCDSGPMFSPRATGPVVKEDCQPLILHIAASWHEEPASAWNQQRGVFTGSVKRVLERNSNISDHCILINQIANEVSRSLGASEQPTSYQEPVSVAVCSSDRKEALKKYLDLRPVICLAARAGVVAADLS